MSNFDRRHYDTEGPLSIPCKDAQAEALETLLGTLPEEYRAPRKALVATAAPQMQAGERADVSWISTEDRDLGRDVVLAGGMDDSYFSLNPIVTSAHNYEIPPVGRSLWRQRAAEGGRVGVKAKTFYPPRPGALRADSPWPPDDAFALVQAGLMTGKSVGFIPLEARAPTADEQLRYGQGVRRVVQKWLLLEYACTWMPTNPFAITEHVAKCCGNLGVPCPKSGPLASEIALAAPGCVGLLDLLESIPRLLRDTVAAATARPPFTPTIRERFLFIATLIALEAERRILREAILQATGDPSRVPPSLRVSFIATTPVPPWLQNAPVTPGFGVPGMDPVIPGGVFYDRLEQQIQYVVAAWTARLDCPFCIVVAIILRVLFEYALQFEPDLMPALPERPNPNPFTLTLEDVGNFAATLAPAAALQCNLPAAPTPVTELSRAARGRVVPFTTLGEIEKALRSRLEQSGQRLNDLLRGQR